MVKYGADVRELLISGSKVRALHGPPQILGSTPLMGDLPLQQTSTEHYSESVAFKVSEAVCLPGESFHLFVESFCDSVVLGEHPGLACPSIPRCPRRLSAHPTLQTLVGSGRVTPRKPMAISNFSKRAEAKLVRHLPLFCGVESTMQLIGGRWKPTILFLLAAQEYRFLALKRAIPGVSLKVFTAQLKALELHGLVKRDQAETRALQVEYSLTPLGQSCIPLLEALEDWGLQHQAELEAVLASGKSALPKNSKV